MIEMNLLPQELKRKETLKLTLPQVPLLKMALGAAAALLALQVLLFVVLVYQKIELAKIKKEALVLQERNKEITLRKTELGILKNELGQIEKLTQRKFYWASLFHALTHSMTKGVWLRSFTVEELGVASAAPKAKESKSQGAVQKIHQLRLDGSVIGQGQETAFIGRFLKELKDNRFFADVFQDVDLSDMKQKRIKDYDVYDFVVVAKFKKEMMGA
ncbi:MAG: hypothetical protein HY593_02165 [Candidatus Omnitrophica bacterium]|nr:hypothetical protein [Candidatus Omnitrophota bacterium]